MKAEQLLAHMRDGARLDATRSSVRAPWRHNCRLVDELGTVVRTMPVEERVVSQCVEAKQLHATLRDDVIVFRLTAKVVR